MVQSSSIFARVSSARSAHPAVQRDGDPAGGRRVRARVRPGRGAGRAARLVPRQRRAPARAADRRRRVRALLSCRLSRLTETIATDADALVLRCATQATRALRGAQRVALAQRRVRLRGRQPARHRPRHRQSLRCACAREQSFLILISNYCSD